MVDLTPVQSPSLYFKYRQVFNLFSNDDIWAAETFNAVPLFSLQFHVSSSAYFKLLFLSYHILFTKAIFEKEKT